MKNYVPTIKKRLGNLMVREASVHFADVERTGDSYKLKIGFHKDGKAFTCDGIVSDEQLRNADDTARYLDNLVGSLAERVREQWAEVQNA